ncbi:MAG: hypothetical protein J6Y02_19130 [Pseudobutyrivibrio sp.]|nr:hypothetical protein [Pseudobutyrivibrio sp.]
MAKLLEIPIQIAPPGEPSSLDVTPFIVLNSYNVSNQPVYEEWTDGYGRSRRNVKRRKLVGTFTLRFQKASDYQFFLAKLKSERTDGFDYILANVYDNKERTVKQSANVYLDFEIPDVEPSLGYSFNEDIEVTLTEV